MKGAAAAALIHEGHQQRIIRHCRPDDSRGWGGYAPFSSIALKSARARCASARAVSDASTRPK